MSVQERIDALTAKAKKEGRKSKTSSASRNGSSLHRIIKTKKQAETFMKLLQTS